MGSDRLDSKVIPRTAYDITLGSLPKQKSSIHSPWSYSIPLAWIKRYY